MQSTSHESLEDNERCQILARNICTLFRRDIPLTPEIRNYLESTAGLRDLYDLEQILDNELHAESESILDLLFFPESWQRLELEPILQQYCYQADDVPRVAALIMDNRPVANFVHGRQRFEKALTLESANSFVQRLALQKQINPELKKTIQATCSEADAWAVLVKLRAAAHPLSAQGIVFFQKFLQRFANRTREFWEYFDCLSSFLQELGAEEDVHEALKSKLELLENAQKKAEQQELDLRLHAVETLQMRRTPILAINRDQIIQELAMLEYLLILAAS